MVKYNIADIDALLNDASRFGIGMDEWIRRFASVHESDANYPPHNLVKESSIDFRLELALAGYSCLLYTSPSPRDLSTSRMPSSA